MQQHKRLFTIKGKAQGTSFLIKYVSTKEKVDPRQIDSLFAVFDNTLSRYNPNSLLSRLNRPRKNAKLDVHLRHVIQQANHYEQITDGVFNIRILPLMQLWGFGSASIKQYPDSARVKAVVDKIYNDSLIINKLRVNKSSTTLALDIDGLAQGYCVDSIADFLHAMGIEDFIIELGGEIAVAGKELNGGKWTIGIERSTDEGSSGEEMMQLTGLDGLAVTTSGSYQQYRKFGDKYINHLIDPRTGYPVVNNIISATVIAPKAIQADALDNVFMVMGINESFKWLENYPAIGLYINYINEKGERKDTANTYFKQFIKKEKND